MRRPPSGHLDRTRRLPVPDGAPAASHALATDAYSSKASGLDVDVERAAHAGRIGALAQGRCDVVAFDAAEDVWAALR